MIFIAYDHNSTIISIVRARTEDLAKAYWQGAGIVPHVSKNLDNTDDFISLDEHQTGVYPILKTRTKSLTAFGRTPHDFILVD